MRGGGGLQGERGQQRETHDHSRGDYREGGPVAAGGGRYAQREQTGARDESREHAAHGHQCPGPEALQTPGGGREGEGEGDDSEPGLEETGAGADAPGVRLGHRGRDGGDRYPVRCDSATLCSHATA
ncbi:hypothetical protein GCM10010510_45410 [Streptomyces anandii JCM 4720]|nr:hypothetical protein GCM10010510_45410 [Streptomyces anandii JCM 4720]